MTIAETMLPEFDQELATTRRVLERVPDGRYDYKPHEKSYTLGQLSAHVANLLTWTGATLKADHFDMADPNAPKPAEPATTVELLKVFDQNRSAARETIAATDDATMMGNWTLKAGDQTFFTLPRVAVMRSFVMNHLIHHRAQLTVYLRMLDVALPSVYGPSADETGM